MNFERGYVIFYFYSYFIWYFLSEYTNNVNGSRAEILKELHPELWFNYYSTNDKSLISEKIIQSKLIYFIQLETDTEGVDFLLQNQIFESSYFCNWCLTEFIV